MYIYVCRDRESPQVHMYICIYIYIHVGQFLHPFIVVQYSILAPNANKRNSYMESSASQSLI